jgi:hypothetical protein
MAPRLAAAPGQSVKRRKKNPGAPVAGAAIDRASCYLARSCQPRQVDHRKDRDPDTVEEMLEKGQTHDTQFGLCVQTVGCELAHQADQPDAGSRDVQAVQGHQVEERGKEVAAAGHAPLGEHGDEVVKFETEKAHAEQEDHGQPSNQPRLAVLALERQ